jgi:hypothetical protein
MYDPFNNPSMPRLGLIDRSSRLESENLKQHRSNANILQHRSLGDHSGTDTLSRIGTGRKLSISRGGSVARGDNPKTDTQHGKKSTFQKNLRTLEEDISPENSINLEEDTRPVVRPQINSKALQAQLSRTVQLNNNSLVHNGFNRNYYSGNYYQSAEDHNIELEVDQGYYTLLNSMEAQFKL